MTKVSASVLEGFAPEFSVFSLPYLFRDEAHRLAFFDSDVGREVLASTEPFRLRGLTYYDAGARSYYTVDKPVAHARRPARAQDPRPGEPDVDARWCATMGGSPTPISWGELYTALQQGVVDGAENNPPSYFLSRHYEVAPYFVLNEHTAVPDVLVVGTPIWDTLSDQEQAWLQQRGRCSAGLEERLWRESTADGAGGRRGGRRRRRPR